MTVHMVDIVTSQSLLPRPLPAYDSGMNHFGYVRGMGISENGNIAFVMDVFIKSEEGKEELKKFEELARKVFRKGTGIADLVKLYRAEVPSLFDEKRINLEITDNYDIILGVNGIQFQILWDYDSGRFEMFYRATPGEVTELNQLLGHFLTLARAIAKGIKDCERERLENRILRNRVGILEDLVRKLEDFISEHVGSLGSLKAQLYKREVESAGLVPPEMIKDQLDSVKQGITAFTTGVKDAFVSMSESKEEILERERRVIAKINEIRKVIESQYQIQLSEEQLMELFRELLVKHPGWVRAQLEDLGWFKEEFGGGEVRI